MASLFRVGVRSCLAMHQARTAAALRNPRVFSAVSRQLGSIPVNHTVKINSVRRLFLPDRNFIRSWLIAQDDSFVDPEFKALVHEELAMMFSGREWIGPNKGEQQVREFLKPVFDRQTKLINEDKAKEIIAYYSKILREIASIQFYTYDKKVCFPNKEELSSYLSMCCVSAEEEINNIYPDGFYNKMAEGFAGCEKGEKEATRAKVEYIAQKFVKAWGKPPHSKVLEAMVHGIHIYKEKGE